MKTFKNRISLPVALLAALTLAACSTSISPIADKPTSPPNLTTPANVIANDNAQEPNEGISDDESVGESGYDTATSTSALTTPGVFTTPTKPGHLTPPATCSSALPSNWVALENLNGGSSAWRINKTTARPTATGYANTTWAVCGQQVRLAVSPNTNYVIQAWRMGYYGETKGRLIWSSPLMKGTPQPGANTPFGTAKGAGNAAGWPLTAGFTITPNWIPGMYLLKLVPTSGLGTFIPLVIRGGSGSVLYPLATHTWNAYNAWGGSSSYYGNIAVKNDYNTRLTQASMNRPYWANMASQYGDGQFLLREQDLQSTLEKWGIPLLYTTDDDLDAHPYLLNSKVIIFGAHSEYFTPNTFAGLQRRVVAGTNIINTGSNTAYWRVRNSPNRLMTIMRSANDPLASSPDQVTTRFRDQPGANPEATLWGGMYDCLSVSYLPGTVVNSGRFPFKGSGATSGFVLKGLANVETDRYHYGISPNNTEVLAHSEFACPGRSGVPAAWDVTYVAAPGHGGVFSAGTMGWDCAMAVHCVVANVPLNVQTVVSNATLILLKAAMAGPLGSSHPSTYNATKVYKNPVQSYPMR